MLRVKLFSTPQVSLHDHLLSTALTGRGLAIFAYLAVSREPRPRSILADLLWTELPEPQARANLRSLLYQLRQILGDYLLVTRQTVAFNRQLPYWLDIEVFTSLPADEASSDPLLQAEVLNLYQHDFLDGFYIPNAPVFETWLLAQRQHFHTQAVTGWQQVVHTHWIQQQYEAGLSANRRLLALEPWHEAAHRQQMRLLAATGQSSAALAHYERCCQILREEVDAPPSAETIALYEQLKAQVRAGHDIAEQENTNTTDKQPQRTTSVQPTASGARLRLDWGAMPTAPQFFGRRQELAALHQWVVVERCRVVSILGLGGQGKTALAAQFVQTLATATSTTATPPFEGIIWRSLLHAPPLTALLQDWLYQLSDQQIVTLPYTLDQQFSLLYEYLRRRRFLLVVDNAESILAATAPNQPDHTAYGQIWELLVQRDHQCCLLLTGRERLRDLHSHADQPGVFRHLVLDGLAPADGEQLLKRYGLQGDSATLVTLQQHYSGNPLALTLVAEAIDEIFAGDVLAFLQEETPFFGDIGAVLDQQFDRLSPLEQELLTWLTLEQEPISSQQLWNNLAAPPTKNAYFTALRALLHRSLIQQQGASFGVPNVILEYVRNRLLAEIYQELTDDKKRRRQEETESKSSPLPLSLSPSSAYPITLSKLNRYGLSKAHAKEHLRAGQQRRLIAPLLQRLLQHWGQEGLTKLVRRLLTDLRSARLAGAPLTEGYAAANLLHLLLQLSPKVRNYDFSHLTLRQVYFRNAQLPDVNLTNATLRDCIFTDAFVGVTALAFHPKGQLLAVGTFHGNIHLWRVGDNGFQAVIVAHPYMIVALASSPDGRWLVSSSVDRKVCLWDAETYTLRYTWQETVNFVRGLTFSPDGQWLAVAGGDGTVKFYAVTSGALHYTLDSPSRWVCSIAFSPDGKWLAGGSSEGALYLWAVDALAGPAPLPPRQTLRGHVGAVDTVLFSADGQTLYSGGRDHLIYLWDLAALPSGRPCPEQPKHTLRGHRHYVRSLALCPTGQCLASGSADSTVRLWDAQTGDLFDTLVGHELWVWGVAFQPRPTAARAAGEPQLLVSVGNDQRIFAWEIDVQAPIEMRYRGRLRQVLQGYADAIRGVAFTPDGRQLVSAGLDKQVRMWDVQTGALQTAPGHHPSWIMCLAISPTGRTIACGDYERQVSLWSLPTATPQPRFPLKQSAGQSNQPSLLLQGHQYLVLAVAFSPDGQMLASGSQDTTVRLWNVASGQLQQTLTDHTDWVCAVAFSPDGQTLASAGGDRAIRLWDVGGRTRTCCTGESLSQTLLGHSAAVIDVAFTPDGKWLVSGSLDQTIRIWGRSGQIRQVLTGHAKPVQALAVSPCVVDGRLTLASCDEDQHLCIWDVDRGEALYTWQEPAGAILRLTYSPDGRILAGANRQGYIRLWDVRSGAVIQTMEIPKPYAGANITGVTGITAAQKATLHALGAVEKEM